MKYSRLIAAVITMAFSISAAAQGSTFISGLEDGYSFIADKCGAEGNLLQHIRQVIQGDDILL